MDIKGVHLAGAVSSDATDILSRIAVFKKHPFWGEIDWSHPEKWEAPFLPETHIEEDTRYFDGRNVKAAPSTALPGYRKDVCCCISTYLNFL